MMDAKAEKEQMIQRWVEMLREVPGSEDCQLEKSSLHDNCTQAYDAYMHSMHGDDDALVRLVKGVAMRRLRHGVEVGNIVKGLWMFRGVASAQQWHAERLLRLDETICRATEILAEMCVGTQGENGYLTVLKALAAALDSKDEYTSCHCQKVQSISEIIADDLGVEIGPAGLFHDLGKIHVPDHILRKPDKLTPAEYAVVKRHSVDAYRMLAPLPSPLPELVLQHHERPDGRGYPLGLTDVPMPAAVVAVADTFHAIVSDRPYRVAQPFEVAVEIINEVKGTQLREETVDSFNRVKDALREVELSSN